MSHTITGPLASGAPWRKQEGELSGQAGQRRQEGRGMMRRMSTVEHGKQGQRLGARKLAW